MGYTRLRKLAFPLLLGTTSFSVAALGLQAFSDVPRGIPFTQAQKQQTAQTPSLPAPVDQEWIGKASRAFNQIAESSLPAVVSISTIRKAEPHPRAPLLPGLPPGMIGRTPPGGTAPGGGEHEGGSGALPGGSGGMPQDPRMLGIGSGFIIRKDGLILTNNHVVENAERVTVTLDEKHKTKARVVGTDPKTDLALIQLEGAKKDYPVISFGDSDQIREGDWAIAIGSPFGLNRSVSFGIISAKGRAQMGILDIEDFIQTDAAINPGSSGGPLLNSRGELVGVNTAIFSQGGGNMGIGFAVPSKIAKEISDELIAKGRVSRGWVGLTAQDLDKDLAKFFKVPVSQGALVSEVTPTGPAGRAALRSGDVVVKYDTHPVDGAGTLKSLVGKTKAGSNIPVEIVREGRSQLVTVAIQEQPGTSPATPQLAGQAVKGKAPDRKPPSFGLAVEDVPAEISSFLNIPSKKGTLVVGVSPGSPAFDAGIGPGDIILSANRKDVHGAKEFKRFAKDAGTQEVAVLFIQRGPTERVYVPVKLADEST